MSKEYTRCLKCYGAGRAKAFPHEEAPYIQCDECNGKGKVPVRPRIHSHIYTPSGHCLGCGENRWDNEDTP